MIDERCLHRQHIYYINKMHQTHCMTDVTVDVKAEDSAAESGGGKPPKKKKPSAALAMMMQNMGLEEDEEDELDELFSHSDSNSEEITGIKKTTKHQKPTKTAYQIFGFSSSFCNPSMKNHRN